MFSRPPIPVLKIYGSEEGSMGSPKPQWRPETRGSDLFTAIAGMILDNKDDFIFRLVTQDVTWVCHFDPETKEQSCQHVDIHVDFEEF